MNRRLGLYLTVLMGLAVMTGYAFQEPRQLPEDQLNEARDKIIDSHLKMVGVPDRDQTPARRAEQEALKFLEMYPDHDQTCDLNAFALEMKKFLQQCPNSEFAPAVQQLLKRVEETLVPAKQPSD